MLKEIFARMPWKVDVSAGTLPFRPTRLAVAATLGLALSLATPGCSTKPLPSTSPMSQAADAGGTNSLMATNSSTLHEGDVVQVKFPGAPELDTTQTIRGDGKITFAGVPDVKISGLTTTDAGKAILDAVGDKIRVKEIAVTVQSQAFIVYITGSVGRPGKLVSDRPLSVLQAVLESGVDSSKSNLKKVTIIRIEADGQIMYKTLDIEKILKQKTLMVDPFTLKPYDTIVVPERFSWL
jgi:polysaccharide export outer membrane protein